MGDSLEYILAQREQQNAAMREAMKLYPDLHFEGGGHLVSQSLRRADCDRIYIVRSEKGDVIRLGKKVGDVTVLCSSAEWMSQPVYDLFRSLKKRHLPIYEQILKLLADSRGML